LKCLLEEISKEVLREQPSNIYDFLATYLEAKLEKECANKERRMSWDQHRWSWEGSSVLDDEELMLFLELHNLTFSEANQIAVIIQSAYRGYKGRQRAKSIRTSLQADDIYLEYDGEDGYITKDSRGNLLRFTGQDVEDILANYQLTLAQANKYAVKIQKMFRGFRTRESFAKEFPELADRLQNIEDRLRKLSASSDQGSEETSAPKTGDEADKKKATDRFSGEYGGEDYYYYEEEEGGEDYLPKKESKPAFGLESFGIPMSQNEEPGEDGEPIPYRGSQNAVREVQAENLAEEEALGASEEE
jgi:hypothetical protein